MGCADLPTMGRDGSRLFLPNPAISSQIREPAAAERVKMSVNAFAFSSDLPPGTRPMSVLSHRFVSSAGVDDRLPFQRIDRSPPRISDRYGAERLDALYRRAAADRDRFRQQQLIAMQPSLLERFLNRFRR